MLTSPQNAQVKRTVRLRQHKARARERAFIIEGAREISRAMLSDLIFDTTFVCHEFMSKESAEFLTRNKDLLGFIQETNDDVFRKISYRENPDGMLAVAKIPDWNLDHLRSSPNGLYLVASGIEKPGNLGAIIRTADAVAVDGVLICDEKTDIFNHHVVRASMGSLFNVPIATTNRENAVNWLRGIDAQIIVTTPGGRDLYSNINLTETTAVVVGNESEGLDEFWLNAGTNTRIPMAGEADSLNVSITAAVTLFEAQRQRNVLQG